MAKGLKWYAAHFHNTKHQKAIGEKSPAYMWTNIELPGLSKRIPENIAAYSREMKLICVMRDPVERAVSHVMHLMRYGRISPLLNINDILLKNAGEVLTQYRILEIGQYYDQLARYLDAFDRSNLLLLVNEADIRKNSQQTLSRLCDFLEVATNYEFKRPNRKVYANELSWMRMILTYYFGSHSRYFGLLDHVFPPKKRSIKQETLNRLKDFYAESNKNLESLLGRTLPEWQ